MTLLVQNRELLDAFRRGDRQALGQVYDAYADHLAAFLRGGFTFTSKGEAIVFKGCRSPSDVQDMLQETFCRAFAPQARLAYDGLHPFGTYLLTIARNLTIDRFRKQVREVYEPVGPHEGEGGAGAIEGEGPRSPEVELLDREVAEIVRAFHAGLSESEREVLRVYFEGEEGQRSAAERLGVTRHQLRRTIARIRKRLEVHLIRSGYISGRSLERRRGAMLLLAALTLAP